MKGPKLPSLLVGSPRNRLDLIYSNEENATDLLPGHAEEVNAALTTRPWNGLFIYPMLMK